jgi:hypothetical protein
MMKLAIAVLTIALTAISVLGQGAQVTQPPTVRIVTDDPNLPSDLYYGNTKVKPLRVRPGTTRPITIDDTDFFIQQHFVDFLSKMTDGTYAQRLNKLKTCAPGNASCDRIAASQSFFNSVEFHERGMLIYKLFLASFGRKPRFTEFFPNVRLIAPYQTAQQLEASKVAFINNWVTKPVFRAKYDRLSSAAYVDALCAAAQVTVANRNALISDLTIGRKTRAQVLRAIAESNEVNNKYYTQAYVVMGYFGYYRREPDGASTQMINTLNTTRDFRAVTNTFLSSPLYRNRF